MQGKIITVQEAVEAIRAVAALRRPRPAPAPETASLAAQLLALPGKPREPLPALPTVAGAEWERPAPEPEAPVVILDDTESPPQPEVQ